MPHEVKDCIEPKIDELLEIQEKKLEEELRKLDMDVERVLNTNIDPLELSTNYLIKYKGNSINSELNKEIRKYLKNKVKAIVTKINDILNQN